MGTRVDVRARLLPRERRDRQHEQHAEGSVERERARGQRIVQHLASQMAAAANEATLAISPNYLRQGMWSFAGVCPRFADGA